MSLWSVRERLNWAHVSGKKWTPGLGDGGWGEPGEQRQRPPLPTWVTLDKVVLCVRLYVLWNGRQTTPTAWPPSATP